MNTTLLGILFGFGAAFGQSGSYMFSRLFVLNRARGALPLLAYSHVLMGIVSAAALPFVGPERWPPFQLYIVPLLATAGFYLAAQLGLFLVLRGTEASRAAPLLGLKILILAGLTTLLPGQAPHGPQWVAVLLAVAAAFVLNYAGGSLKPPVIAGILAVCLGYCLSDLNIRRLVDALVVVFGAGPAATLQASVFGAAMTYVVCGVVGIGLLPVVGRPRKADLKFAAPFAASWLVGMVCLFACFALIGVVFGNIIQSTRGLITVVAGAFLARAGLVALEQRVPGHVFARRVAAAAMMTAAITLYVLSEQGWL
jgi:hypothetical protein